MLHCFAVAKAHNERVVEAARAAVQCEKADDGSNSNVTVRGINDERRHKNG